MSLSILARSSVIRQQALSRSFHASKTARSAHDDYHHLPFQWPGEKKATFGAKVAVYLAFGFSIPFIASYYQIQKSAGASD
ncbi:hypothetical protein CVT25_008725 [Psilocybe cyanescens]|uniref:Cytochrome c oxidase subunit 8, mitochondrial n=1 Tax=Psilocybe cyanescens TaxID=93625 RepID=A0A409XNI3_PSICY|nr:hypothetical protein CVT25_008725 [Psilocybe cyanescens]